jgi:hypothetical protein
MLQIVSLCYKLWVGGWVGGWVGRGGKLSFQCLRPSASLRAAGNKMMTCDKCPKLDVSLRYQAAIADSLQQRPLAQSVTRHSLKLVINRRLNTEIFHFVLSTAPSRKNQNI